MAMDSNMKWHQKPTIIILLLIFFFPLGLYFMWKNELWDKKARWIITIIYIGLIINISNSKSPDVSKVTPTTKNETNFQNNEEIYYDLDGVYIGTRPRHNMKNRFGDDMIIAGNKVKIPPSEYRFILKRKDNSGGNVSLQLTNLDDNSRYYSDGFYLVIKEDTKSIRLKCDLVQDDGGMHILEIDKILHEATHFEDVDTQFSPIFKLNKLE